MDFEKAGQVEGVEIWRIENFKAVPYPKEKYGQFHVGDAYIVLRTVLTKSQSSKGSAVQGASWTVHFWLGSNATQDEYGTAAFKAVELDDHLGGSPVQFREVEGHESGQFLALFKNNIKYLPGGINSGFKDVDAEVVEDHLYKIVGKMRAEAKPFPIKGANISKTECWILDMRKKGKILVYIPPKAGMMNQFKANDFARRFRDEEHNGKASIDIINESLGDNVSWFFKCLETSVEKSATQCDIRQRESDTVLNRPVKLFKISDAHGQLQTTEMKGSLTQTMLDTNDCFILDTAGSTWSGLFVWIGKGANKNERKHAMSNAETYISKNRLPKWTKIVRIPEGCETTLFKQYFKGWKDPEDVNNGIFGRIHTTGKVAEWDIGQLHAENRKRLAKLGGAAIGFYPDDGNGTKEIYRIENRELVRINNKDLEGKFFGGDSYVIKYTYKNSFKNDSYIVYFWQGNESSTDEKAASAIHAIKLDDEVHGKAIQVRVVQGKEPRHFVKMFQGKMVVFSGGKASGFKNIHDHDTYDTDGTRLFRVRGTCPEDVMTTQMQPEKASTLDSGDVFILETKEKTWIWKGAESTSDELTHSKTMVPIISPGRESMLIEEGSETEEFWKALGGKGKPSKASDELPQPILDPRLFHCKLSPTGKFRAYEIYDFSQDQLVHDDAMILDSGEEIYVWIGKTADKNEKKGATKLAEGYLKSDPTDRSKDGLIFTINDGDEPNSFTCCFPSWNYDSQNA